MTLLTATLGFLYIRLHSLLDYAAKLAHEAEHLHPSFDAYPKLASSNILFGDRKHLAIHRLPGSLFEECDEINEIETLRNRLIHDGLLDDMPKAYEVWKGGVVTERFVLLPDRTGRRLDRYKGRSLFYGREDKVNLRLPTLIVSFNSRMIVTLRDIRREKRMDVTDSADMFDALVRERRSVRAFRPEPIPPERLRGILATAQSAPSNCNVQPWVVHLLSGDAVDRLRAAIHAAAVSESAPTPDIPVIQSYSGVYRERRIESAKALFAAEGITRDDMAGRQRSLLRNFLCFDAPHVALIFMPDCFGMREAADCGMYAQTLMLALTASGYASCAQGALSHYAKIAHEQLGVSDDLMLLFGISFGIEDQTHRTRTVRTDRVSVDNAITFHD